MPHGVADTVSVIVSIMLVVTLVPLWAIALVDVLKRADWEFPSRHPGSNDRVFWTLVVLLLNGIGALYYFVVMKQYPRHRR